MQIFNKIVTEMLKISRNGTLNVCSFEINVFTCNPTQDKHKIKIIMNRYVLPHWSGAVFDSRVGQNIYPNL